MKTSRLQVRKSSGLMVALWYVAARVRIAPSWLYHVGSPVGRRNDLMIGDIHKPQRRTAIITSDRPASPSRVNRARTGQASRLKYASRNVRLMAKSQAGIDHSITPASASANNRPTPPVVSPS